MDERSGVSGAGGDLRELRLALVCYGGVSLAIYMHGVTKEIHKLVRASEAFHRDQSRNPFGRNDTERVYWDLLDRMQKNEIGPRRSDRPRTRVVVDIISGTSAGGINGICLAKALAHNLSQDALKDLWIQKGDIGLLWRGPQWVGWRIRAAVFALRLLFPKGVKPPLRGDHMYDWLIEAFQAMDATPKAAGEADTLMPAGHLLELSVPITDFHGYPRDYPIDDPKVVHDVAHRHVLRFRYRGGAADQDQFGPDYNAALAFASRATSSFPGAFPPMSLEQVRRAGATIEAQPSPTAAAAPAPFTNLFDEYRTYGAKYENAVFVDGGVLDNYPFKSSIDAIGNRAAATEVDRRLLFIEPDPAPQRAAGEAAEKPGWLGTIWGALSAIPRSEPIVDDLVKLAERNQNVSRIRDIIETSFQGIRELIAAHLEGEGSDLERLMRNQSAEDVRRVRTAIERKAFEAAGFSAATYVRLRITLLVETYAGLAGGVLRYRTGSPERAFLSSVLKHWAGAGRTESEAVGTLFQRAALPTPRQQEFLRLFDLAYRARQIGFLIAAMSWWYRGAGTGEAPPRVELDRAKALLYGHIQALEAILDDADDDPALAEAVKAAFDEPQGDAASRGRSVEAFVERHRGELERMRDRMGEHISRRLVPLEDALYADLVKLAADWPDAVRRDLFVRYLGFPFLDMLVYPVHAVANVGERDHVEVMRISPFDARYLAPAEGGKLKGVSLAHFSAFLKREYRENDYLWGRLDAAERLITLLLDDPDKPGMRRADRSECNKAFRAILDDEDGKLPSVEALFRHLRDQL